MGRKKADLLYTCPRCGYQSMSTTCIKNHLYKRLTPCKPTLKNIELTDNIRTQILKERIYDSTTNIQQTSHHPTSTTTIININNNINVNNFGLTLDMDIIDKITKYIGDLCLPLPRYPNVL